VKAQGSEVHATASAVETHDRMAAAYQAQRDRLWPSADMWSGAASSFKADLEAPLSAVQSKVARWLREGDVLLDVGGGAGRVSLPLASRCREVICVDPSPGMAEIFDATVRDAAITNARFVLNGWLEAEAAHGDVTLVSHVTYFVPEIAPFLGKLNDATRRRVVIATRSMPPPNQFAPFFKMMRGEDLAPVPGHEHVLAVLKELAIPAELLDLGDAPTPATAPAAKTPEEAIKIQVEGGVRLGWIRREEADRYAELIRARFDELFALTDDGYRQRTALGARELIITWETRR
jgi:SAM-dependent methyltransferase